MRELCTGRLWFGGRVVQSTSKFFFAYNEKALRHDDRRALLLYEVGMTGFEPATF